MIGRAVPHPEWRRIVERLHTEDYGTQYSHEQLAAIAGLVYPSTRYFRQIARARRELLREWEREIETVPRVGYRLVQPSEFHGRHRREVRLAGRRFGIAQDILVAAPQRLLSDAENRRNADALAKLGRLESNRRGYLKQTAPALPPPRPDVPKMFK